jgi:hypothetical protein
MISSGFTNNMTRWCSTQTQLHTLEQTKPHATQPHDSWHRIQFATLSTINPATLHSKYRLNCRLWGINLSSRVEEATIQVLVSKYYPYVKARPGYLAIVVSLIPVHTWNWRRPWEAPQCYPTRPIVSQAIYNCGKIVATIVASELPSQGSRINQCWDAIFLLPFPYVFFVRDYVKPPPVQVWSSTPGTV